MKQIKFRAFKADMIKRGEKTASLRVFDDKDIQKGDTLALITWETGNIFAHATVTDAPIKKLREVTSNDLHGHEQYESNEAMIENMRGYYGERVHGDIEAKIIRFTINEIIHGN